MFPIEIVEEHAIISPYPHSVIPAVVGKGPYMVEKLVVVLAHVEMLHRLRIVNRHEINTPTPCAYPKTAAVVHLESGNGIMGQTAVGRGEMLERLTVVRLAVQTAVNRSCPKSTVGLDVHGIDTVGGNRSWTVAMDIVANLQLTGGETVDAVGFRTYPHGTRPHENAVDESSYLAYGQRRGVPRRKAVSHRVVDVHTSKRPYEEFVVVRRCKTGGVVMVYRLRANAFYVMAQLVS